jgi:hypothetical protein
VPRRAASSAFCGSVFPVHEYALCIAACDYAKPLPFALSLRWSSSSTAARVALARKFAVETAIEHRLDTDRPQDAHHLPLKRAAERVEVSDRPPRQDLVAAIEADQMFDLLSRREMTPAGRQIGHAGHIGKRDYTAVCETDALLALPLERGACHIAGMWRASSAWATEHLSRARVRSLFLPGARSKNASRRAA